MILILGGFLVLVAGVLTVMLLRFPGNLEGLHMNKRGLIETTPIDIVTVDNRLHLVRDGDPLYTSIRMSLSPQSQEMQMHLSGEGHDMLILLPDHASRELVRDLQALTCAKEEMRNG